MELSVSRKSQYGGHLAPHQQTHSHQPVVPPYYRAQWSNHTRWHRAIHTGANHFKYTKLDADSEIRHSPHHPSVTYTVEPVPVAYAVTYASCTLNFLLTSRHVALNNSLSDEVCW